MTNFAQVLADNLPDGEQLKAKNISDSNLRKLLNGMGVEFSRISDRLNWLKTELNLATTSDLITNWEKQYGLPDGLFTITGKTLAQRRFQVLLKEAMNGANTCAEWQYIASLLGYTVIVQPARDVPAIWGSLANPYYTIVVDFYGIPSPAIFNMTFNFVFGDTTSDLLKYCFNEIKPANCVLYYRYF